MGKELLKHKNLLHYEERNCFLCNLQSQGRQESVKRYCFVPWLSFCYALHGVPQRVYRHVLSTEQRRREETSEGRKRERK
jgi:hypothetical protein